MKILVINCGSSSIKFGLFEGSGLKQLSLGIIEKIGFDKADIRFRNHAGMEINSEEAVANHEEGIKLILDALTREDFGCLKDLSELHAVGHRVTHGGDKFRESIRINKSHLAALRKYSELAPLHNPHNLKGIIAIQKLIPDVKQVAVFDTTFHQTLPEHAYMYAIPYKYYEKYKIRRYGFHGTSHNYVAHKACEILKVDIKEQRIISCHLGNGSSITAIKNGQSIDTSMGFTPAEGLIMGTRPGDLDAGIMPYIMKKEGIDCEEAGTILNEQSGILGVSGVSSDMREIEEAINRDKDPRARLSMEMFYYRIRKYIGAYTAVLNGVDIIVFTGGIGENCHEISNGLCHGLDYLGIEMKRDDNDRPGSEEKIISTANSRVTVMIVPTNEELVIAGETLQLVAKKST